MTIFRFSLAAVAAAMLASPAHSGVGADAGQSSVQESCENIDPRVFRKCSERRVKAKELSLKSFYVRAVDAVGRGFKRHGRFDNRTDPAFLKRSQTEWARFVDNDCTVRAAFGGGSNNSITDRYFACYEAELDRRTEFLKRLANESYGIE